MKLLNDNQQRIIELLKVHDCLTVNQFTQRMKPVKTAVRRNLLSLEARRIIERDWMPSSRGRPQLAFRLTSKSNVFFPNKESELLTELIKFLQNSGNNILVDSFFKEYWDKRYQQVLEKLKSKKVQDISARLDALKEVLEDEGFRPRSSLSTAKSEIRLKECHCPIAGVTQMTDLPCHLERRLIERVLNLHTEMTKPCEFKSYFKR